MRASGRVGRRVSGGAIAVAIMIAAEALAIWAYVRLGRYWAGEISVLSDHRLVEGGPFAIVRHPV